MQISEFTAQALMVDERGSTLLHENAKNESGKTPLDIAREKGNSQIVTFLLEKGIDAKDESSKTPLDIARERGDSQIVTSLSSYQRENRHRDQVSDNSWMNNSIVNWFKGLMSSTESPSLLTSTEHNNHAVTPVPEINTTLVNSTIMLGILTAGLLNKTQYRQSIPDNLLSPLEQSMKLNNVDGDRIKKDVLQAPEKFGDPDTDMYEVEVSGNKTGMWK